MGEPERSRPDVVDGVRLSAIAAAFTDAAWQTRAAASPSPPVYMSGADEPAEGL